MKLTKIITLCICTILAITSAASAFTQEEVDSNFASAYTEVTNLLLKEIDDHSFGIWGVFKETLDGATIDKIAEYMNTKQKTMALYMPLAASVMIDILIDYKSCTITAADLKRLNSFIWLAKEAKKERERFFNVMVDDPENPDSAKTGLKIIIQANNGIRNHYKNGSSHVRCN